eukprot:437215-Amphidinium_carterae.1
MQTMIIYKMENKTIGMMQKMNIKLRWKVSLLLCMGWRSQGVPQRPQCEHRGHHGRMHKVSHSHPTW